MKNAEPRTENEEFSVLGSPFSVLHCSSLSPRPSPPRGEGSKKELEKNSSQVRRPACRSTFQGRALPRRGPRGTVEHVRIALRASPAAVSQHAGRRLLLPGHQSRAGAGPPPGRAGGRRGGGAPVGRAGHRQDAPVSPPAGTARD